MSSYIKTIHLYVHHERLLLYLYLYLSNLFGSYLYFYSSSIPKTIELTYVGETV